MSLLPSGFDDWKTREPSDGPEAPCEQTIIQDHECPYCGCPFTKDQVEAENYYLDFDEEWLVYHKECPED